MKCYKPNSDQECTLTVCANGIPCREYIFPHRTGFASEPSDILECFVPVQNHAEITISGSFNGTVLHACFDLLADGSFVGDKHIEGSKDGELKCYKPRKLEYRAIMNVPKEKNWTSIYPPTKVIEGNLGAEKLPDENPRINKILDSMSSHGEQIGLGSIAVVVCLNQKEDDVHDNEYVSMRCGEWKENSKEPKFKDMTDGGITPTHELEFRVDDDYVHINKQSKHRRHFKQAKFGKQPWATFIFYYRSAAAIKDAGCVARQDEYQELCDYGESFEQVAPREKRRAKKKVEPETSMGERSSVAVQTRGTTPAPPPPVAQRPKLFGQTLFSKDRNFMPRQDESLIQNPGPDDGDGRVKGQFRTRTDSVARSESPDTLFVTQNYADVDQDDSYQHEIFGSEAFQNSLSVEASDHGAQSHWQQSPSGNGEVVFDPLAGRDRELSVTGRQDGNVNVNVIRDDAPASATPTSSILPSTKKAAESVKRVHFEGDANVNAAFLNTIVKPGPMVDHDDLRALASDGVVSMRVLVDYCNRRGIDIREGIWMLQRIAPQHGPSWLMSEPRSAAKTATSLALPTNRDQTNTSLQHRRNLFMDSLSVEADEGAAGVPLRSVEEVCDRVFAPSADTEVRSKMEGFNEQPAKGRSHPDDLRSKRNDSLTQPASLSANASNNPDQRQVISSNQLPSSHANSFVPSPSARSTPNESAHHLRNLFIQARMTAGGPFSASPQPRASPFTQVLEPAATKTEANSTTATSPFNTLPPKPPTFAAMKRLASPQGSESPREDTQTKRPKSNTQDLQDVLAAEKAKKTEKQRQLEEMRRQMKEKKAERDAAKKLTEQKRQEKMVKEIEDAKKETAQVDEELEALKKELAAADDDDGDSDVD